MKRYIYYLIMAFFMLVSLSSCEKDLNQIPLSTGTTENFYATENDFVQARNATYSVTFHNYPNRLMILSEIRSDNIYAIPAASQAWTPIHNFSSSIASNPYVEEAYTTNYNAIYKANQLIEKLDENGSVITNEEERNIMIAEAHFLRAFCYFDLIRWFGKVPLIDQTMSPQEASEVERAPVDEVYELILSDLKFAVENLPDSYSQENFGRITKYGAKGILALVHMTRSSPDYGIDGPGLNLDEWSIAYQHLNDIVNSGQYGFASDYSNIFREEGPQNEENVLVIPYESNTGEGVGGNFMAEYIGADSYFASLGLSDQGAGEPIIVSNVLRAKFEPGDKRAEFGIVDSYTVTSGRWEGFYTQPVYTKYADITRYGEGRTDWGVDFMVLRYTDILMLMAECSLHGGGGSQADVDDIVNDVRQRAGLSGNMVNITLEELFEERRKEFFAEGRRWFALFRTGNVITILNNWRAVEDDANVVQEVTNNALIYPIPLQELLSTPGLYEQNPGY